MRLLFLLAMVGFAGIASLISPFAGLLSYTWLAYFRPQNFLWYAQDLRLSLFVGLLVLIGYLVKHRPEKLMIFTKFKENIVMILLLVVLGISTFFASDIALALSKWIQMLKIILIAILTGALVNSKKRFRYMAWVIAGIFGFLAVKGVARGVFLGWHLEGPAKSMIADNNEFALALNMVLPFFIYLGMSEKNGWRKRIFYLVFPLTIAAIVFTFSRGGFVGLCAVILVITLKSRRKLLGMILLVLGVILALNLAPQEYKDRMESIKNYKQDVNAMGRIYAWEAAWKMAKDKPLTGVGLRNFLSVFPNYHWHKPLMAHNSFLQLLAEGGFIALGLFLLLLLFSIKKLRLLRRLVPFNKENAWLHNYSHMLEIGFVAYMVAGFFVSRADFDLLYQFIGMTVALEYIARNEKLIKVRK